MTSRARSDGLDEKLTWINDNVLHLLKQIDAVTNQLQQLRNMADRLILLDEPRSRESKKED